MESVSMSLTLPYIAGMTWGWTGIRGTWTNDKADESLRLMSDSLAINWTAITFAALQDHPQATVIHYKEEPTVTDDEIRHAIRSAKQLGLKVCLKPVVNCIDGTWRAHINFFDIDVPCEPKWSEWFASYRDFMVHYAKLAQEMNCEMLSIGCEMVQTDRREQQWREVIGAVREVYDGLITYNCDKYQENQVKWWDAVDIISSSGYYPVDQWEQQLERIETVVQQYDKPFFFMEAGCPSREGSQFLPNDWGLQGEVSELAQQQFYEAMFSASAKREWVRGFMLWDWPAQLYQLSEASSNDDYCLYGKLSESTVKNYYVQQTRVQHD